MKKDETILDGLEDDLFPEPFAKIMMPVGKGDAKASYVGMEYNQ